MSDKEPVLCYIDQSERAYFTTQDLSKQWGDDWNDAPYEHNAEPPYEDGENPPRWKIILVAYRHPKYMTPADCAGSNSGYSVEQINRKNVAWLADAWSRGDSALEPIFAGITLSAFIKQIRETGGTAGVLE